MKQANRSTNFRLLSYMAILILACVAIGAAHIINPAAANPQARVGLQLAGLLFIGWQHVKLTKTHHLTIISPITFKGLIYTFFLSLVIILMLWFIQYLGTATQVLMPVIAGSAFLLPSVLDNAYKLFQNIPDIQLKPWYKRDNLIDNKIFVFLSTISLQIKVQINLQNETYTSFACTVPGHFELGKVFHYFLIQQQINNAIIETVDDNEQPYGWYFYLERKWQSLVALDADKNLLENRVPNNATIIAKRILPTTGFSFKQTIKTSRYELHQ